MILSLQRVGGKYLFVVPFVSLVEEKVRDLSAMLSPQYHVGAHCGFKGGEMDSHEDVAVATMEKVCCVSKLRLSFSCIAVTNTWWLPALVCIWVIDGSDVVFACLHVFAENMRT